VTRAQAAQLKAGRPRRDNRCLCVISQAGNGIRKVSYASGAQAGLFDVAFDPDFAENGFDLYILCAEQDVQNTLL